jgi:hypothetical protein
MDDNQDVRKTILVPREEFERFQARHPGHGDFTWFVREALSRYNKINDTNPEELIGLAVGEISLVHEEEE